MAIYHLTVKNISRGQGRSAVASAAYRRAARLYDERLACPHDYSDKPDVIHRELSIPHHAPAWVKKLKALDERDKVQSAETLWNKVEGQEKRVDARLAKEIEFALPIELNAAQAITLAREFIQDQCAGLGMIADWSVHYDAGNPHVHVMLTTRALTDEGFGLKVRAWNDAKLVQTWREQWCQYANFHLALHQHEVKIDHRSYQAQGIELVPSIHRGRAVIEMAQAGKPTQILTESKAIQAENRQRITNKPSIVLEKVAQERTAFSLEDVAYELGRHFQAKHTLARQTVVLNLNGDATFSHNNFHEIREKLLSENNNDDPHAGFNQSLLTPETITELLKKIEQFDSVFGERELSQALLPYTESAEQFARLLIALKASDQLVALGTGDDGREKYTTRQMIDLENKIQTLADKLQSRKHKTIPLRKQNPILKAYQARIGKLLTPEQLSAVKHVLGKSALVAIVGRAGTGKSFTLGAAREVWEAQNLRVLGVALSGIAADGLTKDAGIASRTIESFKYALEAKQLLLDQNDVIVMDEAGMTDSTSMAVVLNAVEQAGAKLVLVGDHAQLQPVGPGASFRALVERIGFIELQHVYRQKQAWAAQATIDFSAGQTAKALDAYYQQGCIHLIEDEHQTKAKLIADWQTLKAANGKPLSEFLMIAHRNEDVSALNDLARQMRLNQGEILPGYLVNTKLACLEISQGERILFLKNDRGLGVTNGRFATIDHIELNEGGQVLRITAQLDGDPQRTVTFSPQAYHHFTYGYAATVHKVQGLTVDHTFTYAGGLGWNRHLTYVAKSRHRYSSRLYAAQTTHASYEKLKKSLSRYAIKDSVLDYPLGFSERRGIDAHSIHEKIASHLAARLNGFKKSLSQTYEQIVHPKRYWEKKEALLKQKLNQEKISARREDAKLVAAYIDANKACGKAWQACRLKMQQLGIERLDYASEAFSLFKGTTEYQVFKETINERNQFASRIWFAQDRYQKALEVCNIDLAKLERESKQHVTLERIKAYLTERAKGRVIHRDLIAAQIFADIKVHYRYVKDAGIDVSQIKQNAQSHTRRKLLSELNPQNRSYFKEVEVYRDVNKAVITLGKAIQNANSQNVLISRDKLEVLDKLTLKCNALAYQIYTDESHYQPALNFFEIGTVANTASFEHALSHANARWYRLQQQAMQHVINQRVEHYQDALLAGDTVRRHEIAHHIMQDVKAHHSAILIHAPAANSLWRAIRADSKAYERERLIASLNLAEQADFKRVEDFLKEQQAIREMWQEFYAAKEHYVLPDEKINAHLMPIIHAHTPIRDALAADLTTDPLRYRAALEFYNIKAEDLLKSAHMHHGRARVERYAQKLSAHIHTYPAFIERAKLAQEICQNPKVHHHAMITHKVSWKVLRQDAKVFENHEVFSQLTLDEKKLYRIARRYHTANRQVGRGWSKLIASKKKGIHPLLYNKRKQALVALTAKRDYLAHFLLDQKETLKWQHAFKPAENKTFDTLAYDRLAVKWAEIQKQAMRHSDKVEQVTLWREADNKSYQGLQAINQHALVAKHPESYWDWLSEYEQVEEMGLTIVNNTASYRYALQSIGLTHLAKVADRAALKQKVKEVLKKQAKVTHQKTFSHRALDQDQLKRIQLANKIAKQTKLIKDSIAERYLREHRGIQGLIPATFRYHPRKYCSEAKRYLPALVVIAQNQQKHIQAVQVIYLDPLTANKAKLNQPKLTYGVLQNAAVIVNQGKLKNHIALAEGPETALSIKEANPDLTVYATLGASNFARAPISHVNSILFCADNDGVDASSEKQLNEAAAHFANKGISVYQAKPNFVGKKTDFNDVLKAQGKAAVRNYLEHAKLIKAPQTLEHIETEIQALTNKIIKVNASSLAHTPQLKLLENKHKNESKSINWQTLVTESQPIAGTLGEQYFKEQCAVTGELPKHVHYHPSVWEPDSEKHLPALLSHAIGGDGKAQGIQIIYLDPHTAHKANISNPIRFEQGQEKAAYIPIQKGIPTDDRWFVALSLESAITIAKANSKLRVFCASSYENLANPPFKGQGNALIICADKTHSLAEIKKSAERLAASGFDVYCVTSNKAKDFNSLYQLEGDKAVAKQLETLKCLAKTKLEATIDEKQQKALVEAAKEIARLEKAVKEAKEKLPYAYQVQAREALVNFVVNLRQDNILFKQLKLSDPKIHKRLNLIIKSEQGREL